jgi:hypothetical protein
LGKKYNPVKVVAQEFGMGCAVACVASVTGHTYTQARKLFAKPQRESTTGFYCKDIVSALKKAKKHYSFKRYLTQDEKLLRTEGTIVFIGPNKKYPAGHFLARAQNGWMNPWQNCPRIKPVKANIQNRLPGKPQWIVFSVE